MVTIIDHHPHQPHRPAPERKVWPLLKPGQLVKAQITGHRFQFVPVINDPGPENDRRRRVRIQAPKFETKVQRHNLVVLDDNQKNLSKFDTVHTDLVPVALGKAEDER